MRVCLEIVAAMFVTTIPSVALAQVEGAYEDAAPVQAPTAAPSVTTSPPPTQPAPLPAPIADQPSTADATPKRTVDHQVELGARVGVLFPGEMSPSNWLHHDTRAAPLLTIDPAWVAGRYFEIGGYLHLAPLSIERGARTTYQSDVDGLFVSAGVAAKGRLEVGDTMLLRGGLTFGRNGIAFSGKTNGSTVEATGGGFNAGLVVDGVWRASKRIGLSSQLGFVSQVAGSAEVKGPPTAETGGRTDRDFRFAPIFFLTVGPEVFL